MQTPDFSTEIVLSFTSLNVNCKQANQRVIWANWSDIQTKQSDVHANNSVDFYYVLRKIVT